MMNSAQVRQTLPTHDKATSLTALHSLRAEADEYGRLSVMLRAARRLFAEDSHAEAQASCEGVLQMARELEQRAVQRRQLCDAKGASRSAEDAGDLEFESACADLLNAQLRTRGELVATMELLSDMRGHTAAFRNLLIGNGSATYDRNGQTLDAGGQ
jgi:hypothetical protein